MANTPTPYSHPNAVIAIMAKAPVAGQVKTRMQPQLSEMESATLQANLIAHTLNTCLQSQMAPVQLWCAPNTKHPCFVHYSKHAALHTQVGDDLGQRMRHVFEIQQDKEFTLIIGTDCPLLTEQHLTRASQAIQNHDVILQPATDGGYVLIGGRETPQCFKHIDWGTENVLEQSTRALSACQQTFKLLDTTPDLDYYEDLNALPDDLQKKLIAPNAFI